MLSPSFVLCDVFAERPFTGNPLAVFLDADDLADEAMARIGREFGWSEVTFVSAAQEVQQTRVRIWTPWGELPFAGHPTIGTAVVLASRGRIDRGWAALELGIGSVAVEITDLNPQGGEATMVQRPPLFGATWTQRSRLAAALQLEEDDLLADLPAQTVSTGRQHFLVPLRSRDALYRASAAANLLPGILEEVGVRSVYLFSVETPQTTAAARARLINVKYEDAATGSAAGPLGAYLVQYGLHRPGVLDIEQGVEMGRPSRITVDVTRERGELGPVRVSGRVFIWGSGRLETMEAASLTLET